MATNKITLNELRSLIQQTINEVKFNAGDEYYSGNQTYGTYGDSSSTSTSSGKDAVLNKIKDSQKAIAKRIENYVSPYNIDVEIKPFETYGDVRSDGFNIILKNIEPLDENFSKIIHTIKKMLNAYNIEGGGVTLLPSDNYRTLTYSVNNKYSGPGYVSKGRKNDNEKTVGRRETNF